MPQFRALVSVFRPPETPVLSVFVFVCSRRRLTSASTYPKWRPQKTDHMPIISELDIEPERITYVGKYNYKLTDWEEFRKTLEENLEEAGDTKEITSEAQFVGKIASMEGAIKATIHKHVPLTKLSPYTKRWWSKELDGMKRNKERLARDS